MGGRGNKGKNADGGGGSASGESDVKYTSADKTTFEGEELTDTRRYQVYSSKGFKFAEQNNVYEAKSEGNGVLNVNYAKGKETNGNIPQRGDEGTYTYTTTQGFKTGYKEPTQDTGINWNNVKEVKGQTYNIKDIIKEKGFKWDSKLKSWKK